MSAAMASVPAPFFLAYGLRKEGFVGTMGLSVFSGQVVMMLAPFVVLGTWLGKQALRRVTDSGFVTVVEVFMVVSGGLFLVRG